MDHSNNTINSRKYKHLSFEERMTIQIRLKDGYSAYKIAKELGRASNTIRNEIARGTVSQIKQGKLVNVYLADTGAVVYSEHRKNCCPKYKRFVSSSFIEYVCMQIKEHKWSVDACFGKALNDKLFSRSQMVCTKTLYNYIDLQLLDIRNSDLPLKLRRNTKSKVVRTNRRRLGTSIEDRPADILTREEFGHWEIDTVIGTKDKQDSVLLTLAERQTRHYIVRKIASKTATAVQKELLSIKEYFAFVEDWCNTLPRKILNYQTPEERFEEQLDSIYATT